MSSDISLVASTVFTMFLVICTAYAARKLGAFDGSFAKKLSDLIIIIGQPFMIIAAMMKIEFSPENLRDGGLILLLGIAALSFSALIGYFAMKPLKDADERKIGAFALIFSNCGFMGFPVLSSMFGDIGLFRGAFYVVAFNLVQWTYGMILLGRGREDIKPSVRSMLINYATVPCAVGFVFFVCRYAAAMNSPIGLSVYNAFNYLGSLCTPISLVVLGFTLARIPLKTLITRPAVLYCTGLRLFAVPLAVTLVCALIGLPDDLVLFATVMTALPTATTTVIMGEKYSIAPDFGARIVSLTTLLSPITVPAVLMLAKLICNAL